MPANEKSVIFSSHMKCIYNLMIWIRILVIIRWHECLVSCLQTEKFCYFYKLRPLKSFQDYVDRLKLWYIWPVLIWCNLFITECNIVFHWPQVSSTWRREWTMQVRRRVSTVSCATVTLPMWWPRLCIPKVGDIEFNTRRKSTQLSKLRWNQILMTVALFTETGIVLIRGANESCKWLTGK